MAGISELIRAQELANREAQRCSGLHNYYNPEFPSLLAQQQAGIARPQSNAHGQLWNEAEVARKRALQSRMSPAEYHDKVIMGASRRASHMQVDMKTGKESINWDALPIREKLQLETDEWLGDIK